ncbi:hypothetical protein [Streptomyces werraensis]|uniref:hypothetical protein n=1 Tax=Streptomyces werraensis TaxID=68284 RepID=UPI00382EAF54
MTELDPELKARILEFVREREQATVSDVRRKFFPGDISRPYLYLDALTASRELFVMSVGDGPTTWASVQRMTDKAAARRAELRGIRLAERAARRAGKAAREAERLAEEAARLELEKRRVQAYGVMLAEIGATETPRLVTLRPCDAYPRSNVLWRRYAKGKPYVITDDEAQTLFGISVDEFRCRLRKYCRRHGWSFRVSEVMEDAVIFSIEKP